VKKTYHGSCHCGAVRFECELDLAEGTSRCNCSICRRARFWKAIVSPDAFRLVAGADSLSEYRFGSHNIAHRFCRNCGIKPFGVGHSDGAIAFYAINVLCLDASDEALAAAPVEYQDGRENQWGRAPAETGFL